MKLNNTEAEILLAIITGNVDKIKEGKRTSDAIDSLKQKGFIRGNQFHIVELNLSNDYFKQRGY
jgi:hypothetical protein|nr:MAG TPA: hypothetical protein [Caudoviricetes sp.]